MVTIVTELDRLYTRTPQLEEWAKALQLSHVTTLENVEYFQGQYYAWLHTTYALLPEYTRADFWEPYQGKPLIPGSEVRQPAIHAFLQGPLDTRVDWEKSGGFSSLLAASKTPAQERTRTWSHPFESYFQAPFHKQKSVLLSARHWYAAQQTILPFMPHSAPPLAGIDLHPRILAVVAERYLSGQYDDAIMKSFVAVNEAVREKSGSTKEDGTKLMHHAFNSDNPILCLSEQKAERLGYMELFAGSWGALRNPRAHSTSNKTEHAHAALELIAFASALMRLVDQAVLIGQPATQTP